MLIYCFVFLINLLSYLSAKNQACKDLREKVDDLDQKQNQFFGNLLLIMCESNVEELMLQFNSSIISIADSYLGTTGNLGEANKIIKKFLNINNGYFNNATKLFEESKNDICSNTSYYIDKYNEINLFFTFVRSGKLYDYLNDFYNEDNNNNILNLLYLIPELYSFSQDGYDSFDKVVIYLKNYSNFSYYLPEIADAYINDGDILDIFRRYFNTTSNYCFINSLRLFVNDTNMAESLKFLLKQLYIDKKYIDFCDYINEHLKEVSELYEIFNEHNELINDFFDILEKREEIENLVEESFQKMKLIDNRRLISIILTFSLYFADGNEKMENFVDLLVQVLRGVLSSYSEDHKDSYTYSKACHYLFEYAVLGKQNYNTGFIDPKNISNFFLYKVILDSPKSFNDLLNYDNCLKRPPALKYITLKDLEHVGIVPSFVIGAFDRTVGENKNSFKKNTGIEENYFVLSVCLPQSLNDSIIYNGTKLYCSDEDFSKIMNGILYYVSDTDHSNITAISIKKGEDILDKVSIWELLFAKLIPLYIILIPFIFAILIFFFKKNPKKNRNTINNINEKDNNKKEGDKELIDEKIENPKWILFLDRFFNFGDNSRELFNFEFKITQINNVKGLNYIGGLMGTCIVFTVLGQVYLILYNLPMKDFGISNFYNLFNSFYYIFFFVGLRYSPRILFSCSGYTLSYKYLSYIEKHTGNIAIKFIFLQSYKYLFLVLFLLFSRISIYYFLLILYDLHPAVELFKETVLMIPKGGGDFFLCLLGIKSFFNNKIDSRSKHYLIDYFWMAFNEIFFFIIGTILISLGKYYKLRIDYFLIILILILYLGKIIIYYIYYNAKEEIYTTLYYYIFDYGEMMLNPIFNLIYYLIGMYFGLINYIFENGIIDLYKENKFSLIMKGKKSEDAEKSKKDSLTQLHEINKDENEDNEGKELISNENQSEKKDFLINKVQDINNKNSEEVKDYVKELKEMPFLISGVKIRKWHNKTKTYIFYILMIICTVIFILFCSMHYNIIRYYNNKIDNDEEDLEQNLKKLSLESVITNKFLNFIYLIDIELVVLFVQWSFFTLFVKQQFIIDFFSHIYWTFFYKFYYSFLLTCNFIILIIFYESETVIKLNLFNLVFFFFISIVLIFIITSLNYIGIELPLKKIFKSFLYDELNHFYNHQEKISKSEDNIGKMFSDNESNSGDDEESEEEEDLNKKINDIEDDD